MTHAEAPSNIALIKYMGKKDRGSLNVPENSSISLTLPHFRSRVQISPLSESNDHWQPLNQGSWSCPELSEKGRTKFLEHFRGLKSRWQMKGHFLIQSGNNFPSDCGVASSASSFAALTLASYQLAREQNPELDLTESQLAEISREGSGSSCRSFGAPWVLWRESSIETLDPDWPLKHELILVDSQKKEVTSSEAHGRVQSSSLFEGRPERANARLYILLKALQNRDWPTLWQVAWDELWDMHNLFHTSKPPFAYMSSTSFSVLEALRQSYQQKGDGPLITMDAGANIHLIYRQEQESVWPELQRGWPELKILKGLSQ